MFNHKIYKKNYYSQFGEDGIIEEILFRLSQVKLDKWCVEFGAWDGVYCSNTCHLIKNKGYNAVLIEGDKSKFSELKKNFPQNNVHKVNKYINIEGAKSLENILSETPIPKDFDFLSIDIDGADYYIFEGLNNYKPKIICIEFNPSIPNTVDFKQPKDINIRQGSSALAINRLANHKRYKTIAATNSNLILLREDLIQFVAYSVPSLHELNNLGNSPQYLFVGYDGTILSNKKKVDFIWHGVQIPISNNQFLPSYFRIFAGDYGFFRKLFFFLFIKKPDLAFKHISKKIKSYFHK
jgi:hypothetical protein